MLAALAAVAVATVQNDAPERPSPVTGPGDQFGVRMPECLIAKRWDASASPNNSYEVLVPDPAESTRLQADKKDCGQRLGYDIY